MIVRYTGFEEVLLFLQIHDFRHPGKRVLHARVLLAKANLRQSAVGLSEQYPGVKNPFPWMSESMDLKKEKNFFETRVIEYQTGGALTWD